MDFILLRFFFTEMEMKLDSISKIQERLYSLGKILFEYIGRGFGNTTSLPGLFPPLPSLKGKALGHSGTCMRWPIKTKTTKTETEIKKHAF